MGSVYVKLVPRQCAEVLLVPARSCSAWRSRCSIQNLVCAAPTPHGARSGWTSIGSRQQ